MFIFWLIYNIDLGLLILLYISRFFILLTIFSNFLLWIIQLFFKFSCLIFRALLSNLFRCIVNLFILIDAYCFNFCFLFFICIILTFLFFNLFLSLKLMVFTQFLLNYMLYTFNFWFLVLIKKSIFIRMTFCMFFIEFLTIIIFLNYIWIILIIIQHQSIHSYVWFYILNVLRKEIIHFRKINLTDIFLWLTQRTFLT